ncbi:MAG TPA: porin [Azospirillaceae bacterium]|nr:porin [Azospirillaceae bacterium]
MRSKILLLALACLAGPSAAWAQAPADTTEELLLRLKEKGILTDQEYQALVRRKAAEAPARAAPPAAPAAGTGAQAGATPAQTIDPKAVRMAESGVGLQLGDVTVKLSGSINGFYTYEDGGDAGPGSVVVGGLASAGGSDTSSVRNGLLPGFLKVDVTTTQAGWDVGAHFGIYPGINSVTGAGGANSPGQPTALSTAGIDFRQTYLTFGRKELGEVKIGRDIGLFASEAILNDITLFSVGTAAGNAAPSNTSLGRIGLGYIYTDFQPQITYTTPTFGGLQASVGVFQPLLTAGATETNDQPGFQGEITYDVKAGGLDARAWASFVTQRHDGLPGLGDYRGTGFDVGAKLGFGPAGFTGYYYTGKGIGTTGLFILAADAAGNRRDSDGFYLQGTMKFMEKAMLGVSYGESRLDLAEGEVNPTLVDSNQSWALQGRYSLTDWVTLVTEYILTESEAHNGNEAESDTVAVGAIVFF